MKCSQCGSQWESRKIMTACPFCGEALTEAREQPARPETIHDIPDAIRYAVAVRGEEVMLRPEIVAAYIDDLVESHERAKALFRFGCRYKVPQQVYGILCEKAKSSREIKTMQLKSMLMRDAFMEEQNAVALVNMTLAGVGLHELRLSVDAGVNSSVPPSEDEPSTADSPTKKPSEPLPPSRRRRKPEARATTDQAPKEEKDPSPEVLARLSDEPQRKKTSEPLPPSRRRRKPEPLPPSRIRKKPEPRPAPDEVPKEKTGATPKDRKSVEKYLARLNGESLQGKKNDK